MVTEKFSFTVNTAGQRAFKAHYEGDATYVPSPVPLQTGRTNYLDEARRIGEAADYFCNKQTGVYRDPLKWSQFMVEADLDLYRTTHEEYLLGRARTNADAYFAAWKKSPPADMMSNVATARILYLLAESP